MTSPPSSPDIHPPAYFQPTSPPQQQQRPLRSPPPPSPTIFLPPPAVTTFAYAPSISAYELQRSPLQQLQNQAARLTSELQHLLNTQSDALLSLHTNPKLSLASARTGILSAMRELADVKAREATLYSSLSDQRKHLLSTVSTHTQKSTRLRQELEKIDSLPEAKRASELREQTATVADEIAVLRQKLRELEKSHKGMQAELAGLDNIVEARASSYKAALEAVSRKTVAFLREQGGQQKSPETAAEAWGLEAEAYSEKREEAEREGGALREGMELWEGAMRRVCGFEEGLQKRIDAGGGREAMEGLKEEIEKVAEELEDMVETAERRGWKLMVVAVGAELQAFREAGEVLKNQLRLVGGSRDSAGGKVEEHGFGNVNDDGDRSRFLGDDGGI